MTIEIPDHLVPHLLKELRSRRYAHLSKQEGGRNAGIRDSARTKIKRLDYIMYQLIRKGEENA